MGLSPILMDLSLKSRTFTSLLTDFVNTIIDSRTVPPEMKHSKIVPIPKIPNPFSPNELRPISIQPILTKIVEKCIVPQLCNHLNENNLISCNQFGFRKHHGTEHAMSSHASL